MNEISTKLKIEQRKIGELKRYERNARKHSEQQIEQLTKSMQEFGWTMPILISSDNTVIAGHGRLAAATRLGLKTVPCITADHLTEKQCKAYVIADNQLALNSSWDSLLLAEEISELRLESFDMDLIGFNDAQLAQLFPDADEANAQTEWRAMPEFKNNPIAYRSIIIHFKDQAAVDSFAAAIGQELLPTTKFTWHPAQPREYLADKLYVADGEQVAPE